MANTTINLADLRRDYMLADLDEAGAPHDAFELFERWMKDSLDASLPISNAMALATVTPEGKPDARIVLLKGIDQGGFVFYTNYASRKGEQLAAHADACLVFYWIELERQVRIEGRTHKVSAQESDEYYASRPLGSRLSAWASFQSQPVPDRQSLEDALAAAENRFGARPPRPPHWGGYRLIPTAIEFWQGRANRLHDRLLYRRTDSGWKIQRLAP